MPTFFIRVDVHPEYENAIQKLESFCEKILGVYHTGKNNNNPHWHFVVCTDAKSIPCLRARVRKFWDVPKSISIKDWNLDKKAIVYMFHEKEKDTFKVVSCKGFTEEEVKQFKDDSVNLKKSDDGRKKREPTFTEKLVDRAIEEFGTEDNHKRCKEIQRWVIKQFGAQRKVWDEYVIYKAYNLVAQHVIGKPHVDEALERLQTVIQRNDYRPY